MLHRIQEFKETSQISIKKTYVFLGFLTHFEVAIGVPHGDFVIIYNFSLIFNNFIRFLESYKLGKFRSNYGPNQGKHSIN